MKDVKFARKSGRGIRRLVTLCGTVTQLIAEYDRHLLESESNDDDDNGNDNGSDDDNEELRVETKRYVCEMYDPTRIAHGSTSQASQPQLSVIP